MLSKKVQYSIVALTKLAREYGNGPLLIGDIAEQEKIPKKFLEAILLDLKNAGYLGSKKGRGGGYYLIKKPAEINLADIIRHFDGAIALLPCATFKYYEKCPFHVEESTCGFRSIIKEVRDQSVKILKNNTLADILERENILKNNGEILTDY